MLNSVFSSLIAKRLLGASWTCARCRSSQLLVPRPPLSYRTNSLISRQYGSKTGRSRPKPISHRGRRTAVLLATAGGGATVGLLAVGDDVKNAYEGAERTGRVVGALVMNVNDYRNTLNARDKVEDPGDKEAMLNACHKRCAVRTLKVLEKNGGIFIKLGQHLVC